MRRLAAPAVLAALVAAPAPAQGPVEATGSLGKRTSMGRLHEAGYQIGAILTAPATDAAAVRFSFTMEHGEERMRPIYMCRLFVGPGDSQLEEDMILINACERIE